jgi:hypothetical protein
MILSYNIAMLINVKLIPGKLRVAESLTGLHLDLLLCCSFWYIEDISEQNGCKTITMCLLQFLN